MIDSPIGWDGDAVDSNHLVIGMLFIVLAMQNIVAFQQYVIMDASPRSLWLTAIATTAAVIIGLAVIGRYVVESITIDEAPGPGDLDNFDGDQA